MKNNRRIEEYEKISRRLSGSWEIFFIGGKRRSSRTKNKTTKNKTLKNKTSRPMAGGFYDTLYRSSRK